MLVYIVLNVFLVGRYHITTSGKNEILSFGMWINNHDSFIDGYHIMCCCKEVLLSLRHKFNSSKHTLSVIFNSCREHSTFPEIQMEKPLQVVVLKLEYLICFSSSTISRNQCFSDVLTYLFRKINLKNITEMVWVTTIIYWDSSKCFWKTFSHKHTFRL